MADEVLDGVNEIRQLCTRTILIPIQEMLPGGIQLGDQATLLWPVELLITINGGLQVINGLHHSLHCYREAATNRSVTVCIGYRVGHRSCANRED